MGCLSSRVLIAFWSGHNNRFPQADGSWPAGGIYAKAPIAFQIGAGHNP